MGSFFESGSVVEAEGVEPVLRGLREGEFDRAICDADCRVVVGEGLDMGGKSEVSGSMEDLPMLVAIDWAGDEEIPPGGNVAHQRLPCFFTQRLRRRQDRQLR